MFPCPKCGAQISVGQRVCAACGEKFDYRCARCGATFDTNYRFCAGCGAELGSGMQQPVSSLGAGGAPYHKRGGIYQHGKSAQKRTSSLPTGWMGVWLGSIAIMLCIGAVIYAVGIDSQAESAEGLDGGFIFQQKSPAPAPVPQPSTEPEEEPVLVPDLPRYAADEVMVLAKSFSTDCRKKVPG